VTPVRRRENIFLFSQHCPGKENCTCRTRKFRISYYYISHSRFSVVVVVFVISYPFHCSHYYYIRCATGRMTRTYILLYITACHAEPLYWYTVVYIIHLFVYISHHNHIFLTPVSPSKRIEFRYCKSAHRYRT